MEEKFIISNSIWFAKFLPISLVSLEAGGVLYGNYTG